MKNQISVFLALFASALPALAGSTIGSVWVGAQSPNPVNPGSSASYAVTVTRAGSGNLDVYLTITNLPLGVTASFVPSLVHFGSSGSTNIATLTISTGAGTLAGNYTFLVTARDGGSPNIKTSSGSLTVTPNSNAVQTRPSLSLQKLPNGSAQIHCNGTAGYSYQLQATSDLANPSWTTIGSATGDLNGHCVLSDPEASSHNQRFYRALTTN